MQWLCAHAQSDLCLWCDDDGDGDHNGQYYDDDYDLAQLFLEWICLQVDRFQAPHKITTRKPEDSEVKPKEIIRILEKKIAQGVKMTPIFQKFDPINVETYKYNATVHCQAALAALHKFPGCVVGDHALRDHIQVWSHFRYHHDVCKSDAWHRISTTAHLTTAYPLISMSKRCCPVCWELLEIFKDGDSTNFHVDGYHKTLFQVELPDWLPLEIVVKLTARFEEILLKQIRTLVERHKRDISDDQSDSDSEFKDYIIDAVEHSYSDWD